MPTIEEELLDIALEGLANQKITVDKHKKLIQLLQNRDEYKDGDYQRDHTNVLSKLDNTLSTINDTVKSYIDAIPIPKDGEKGKDGESIKGDTGAPGKDGKSITGPQGKDGVSIEGKPGKDGKSIVGPKGKDGKDGKDASEAVSIKSIKSTSNKLIIELTDGTVKDIKLPKAKSVPAGVTAMPTEVVVMRNLADTDIKNATEGQVLTLEGKKWVAKTPSVTESQPGDVGAIERRAEIESMFKVVQTTAYKEITYDQGNITNVDIYATNSKTTKLFSKIIGYNNGNISTVSITDEVNGGTLNKAMSYVSGNIANITSTYTQ